MKKTITLLIPFLCATFMCSRISGQEKYEKEYRIKEKEVPIHAIQFIKALKFNKKIKWYIEEGLHTKSIEAKTKFNKKRYSIEFDTLGNLQDVEIQISQEEIPENTLSVMNRHLKEDFTNVKFIKVQLQYTGEEHALLKIHTKPVHKIGITIKYEIVLEGKKEGKSLGYEYLFSEHGYVESKALIRYRRTDNLEY